MVTIKPSEKTVKAEKALKPVRVVTFLRPEDLEAIATALRAAPTSAATSEALARVEARIAADPSPRDLRIKAERAAAKTQRAELLAAKKTIRKDAAAEAKKALAERYLEIDAQLKALHDARNGKKSS